MSLPSQAERFPTIRPDDVQKFLAAQNKPAREPWDIYDRPDDPQPGVVWHDVVLRPKNVTAEEWTVTWQAIASARSRGLFITPADLGIEGFTEEELEALAEAYGPKPVEDPSPEQNESEETSQNKDISHERIPLQVDSDTAVDNYPLVLPDVGDYPADSIARRIPPQVASKILASVVQ